MNLVMLNRIAQSLALQVVQLQLGNENPDAPIEAAPDVPVELAQYAIDRNHPPAETLARKWGEIIGKPFPFELWSDAPENMVLLFDTYRDALMMLAQHYDADAVISDDENLPFHKFDVPASVTANVERLENEKSNLEKKIDGLKAGNNELRDEIEARITAANADQSEISELKKSAQNLVSEVASNQEELGVKAEEISKLVAHISTTENEARELRVQVSEQLTEIENLTSASETLQKMLDDLTINTLEPGAVTKGQQSKQERTALEKNAAQTAKTTGSKK